MKTLEQYNKVTLIDVEIAIDELVNENEKKEVIEMCEAEFEKEPSPFWHCAEMLRKRGYDNVVKLALKSGGYMPHDDWELTSITRTSVKGLKTYQFQTWKVFTGAKLFRDINAYSEKDAWNYLTPPRP